MQFAGADMQNRRIWNDTSHFMLLRYLDWTETKVVHNMWVNRSSKPPRKDGLWLEVSYVGGNSRNDWFPTPTSLGFFAKHLEGYLPGIWSADPAAGTLATVTFQVLDGLSRNLESNLPGIWSADPAARTLATVTCQVLDGLSKHLESNLPGVYQNRTSGAPSNAPADRRSPGGEARLRYDLLQIVDFVISPKC